MSTLNNYGSLEIGNYGENVPCIRETRLEYEYVNGHLHCACNAKKMSLLWG